MFISRALGVNTRFCRAGHVVGYRLSANEQAGRRPVQHGRGDRSSPRAFRLRGVGQVRVGTASWTDRTLIESGWYPPEADTPERRLRFYARQFGLVEVDATYYALPGEQTAALWAARTPAGFTFNVKAFSLFTHHPTPVAALPAGLRSAAEKTGKDRVYFQDLGPAVADAAWQRFAAALAPLRAAGKL